MLTKPGFRQSNIVCIGILSLLIVKANDLAFFKWQKGIFSQLLECLFDLFIICCSYLQRLPQPVRQIKLSNCFRRRTSYFRRSKQQLIRYFIQDLSLNFHSYLDVFLYGSSSSFNNLWLCHQRYHGSKIWVENLHLSFGV